MCGQQSPVINKVYHLKGEEPAGPTGRRTGCELMTLSSCLCPFSLSASGSSVFSVTCSQLLTLPLSCSHQLLSLLNHTHLIQVQSASRVYSQPFHTHSMPVCCCACCLSVPAVFLLFLCWTAHLVSGPWSSSLPLDVWLV